MNQAFTTVDWVVAAVLLAATVAGGLWFGRRARSSDGLLLANRTLGWGWLAPTLGLAGLTALVVGSAPLDGYPATVGLRLLLLPMGLCVAVPVAILVAVPLYRRLDVDSVGEYLELRFDARTRAAASLLQALLQIVWLAGLLALPGRLAALAGLPAWLLIVALGTAATACATYGGLRGAAAAAVGQSLLMIVAIGILLTVALVVTPTTSHAWGDVSASGRTTTFDAQSPLSSTWSAWPAALFAVLAALYFFVADQATVQRALAARGAYEAPYGIFVGAGIAGVVMSLGIFASVGIFAVYHENAHTDLPPQWVTHFAVDTATGRPMGDADTVIDEGAIKELVRRGAILDPNSGKPFTTDQMVSPDIYCLATRLTRKQGGEHILRAGQERVVGRFLERRVGPGVRGVVLAGVSAAAVGAAAVGLLAVATLLLIDFHRRFGWAENWLARRAGKPPAELDQADELRLVRPAILLMGAAITAVGVACSLVGDLPGWLLRWLGVLGGPILAVFLLGLFTRRTTAAGALVGLAAGIAAAAYVALCGPLSQATGVKLFWPWAAAPGATWPMTVGACTALVGGYLTSWAVGVKRSSRELAGLVVGLGALGVLRPLHDPHAKLAELEQRAKVPPKRSPWR